MKRLNFIVILLMLSGCAIKSPMVVSPTGDGKHWILRETLVYQHPVSEKIIEVPRGFVTDLASVPRLFWSVFPPCDTYTSSAVIHDYLYWFQLDECDRKCADNVLRLAMKEAGVEKVTRDAIYNAVRIGGASAWNENAELRKQGVIRVVPERFMKFGPYETWEKIEANIKRSTKE